jgi:hypothetical protein
MLMRRYAISPGQNLELPKLQVYRGFFPSVVLAALHNHILAQPERKIMYQLTDSSRQVPVAIGDALSYGPLSDANTIITKRYSPSEDSEAFGLHRDPDKYAGSPIVLSSLGGQAMLSVVHDGCMYDIDCVPNTVVVTHDNPLHAVSPPLDSQIRTFMFAGTDSTHLT